MIKFPIVYDGKLCKNEKDLEKAKECYFLKFEELKRRIAAKRQPDLMLLKLKEIDRKNRKKR